MNEKPAFSIDLGSLKTRRKDNSPEAIDRTDVIAEQHGFVNREGQGRRGRKPSPRTGQVHAKVMPNVADEIAEEARRRGVQQGVVVEEAWALYKSR
jgi:hypothetical protein